jgi:hypothetical protein
MKELIKKILIEQGYKKRNWYEEWEYLPVEERIEEIKRRKEHIVELLPLMIKFFENKFGSKLKNLEVLYFPVKFAHENYVENVPYLSFNFNWSKLPIVSGEKIRHTIHDDIKNYFGIPIEYYGIPLNVRFESI